MPKSYGFPSDTALLTVAVLGAACYLLVYCRAPRPVVLTAVVASVVASVIVGLSRIYVGEHWAMDVLGGWLSGGALVLVAIFALRSWRPGGTDGRDGAGPRKA